jgi:hypothetical protein
MNGSYPRNLVPWLICCLVIAIAMYSVGLAIRLSSTGLTVYTFLHAALTDGLRDISIAIGTAVVLALGVDLFMHKDLVGRINEKFILVRAAEGVGLHNILLRRLRTRSGTSRTNAEFDRLMENVIVHQLERDTGQIRIICVAAPEYLHTDSPVGIALLNYYSASDRTQTGCKLRILHQDPACEAANVRASLEKPSNTIAHIHTSVAFIGELKGSSSVIGLVDHRAYNREASVFLVMTDSQLLIEPLPICDLTGLSRPLGGQTPICVFTSDNEVYTRWASHFEYLWKNCPPSVR